MPRVDIEMSCSVMERSEPHVVHSVHRLENEHAMFRFIIAQIAGGFLTKAATSGRYPRIVSAILGVAAARMGGPSRIMGIWGLLSAFGRRGR